MIGYVYRQEQLMKKKRAPDWVHLFICVNDRHGERRSCADGDALEIRNQLKQRMKDRGWWNQTVRISGSGCLGLCQQGPNAILHPEGIYYSHLSLDDLDQLENEMATMIENRDR
jgi:(2Fe-2S) ferredoxin